MKRLLPLGPVLLLLVAAPTVAAPFAGDASRYNTCLALVKTDPARAIANAQAWRIEAGGAPAQHCLALAQFEHGDYAEALKSFEGAATKSEGTKDGLAATLWSQGADAALLARQPETAARFLTRALESEPGSLSPHAEASLRLTRAEAYVDLKTYPAAAADLDRAVTLWPDVPWGWLLKATLARRMGELKTAEAAIVEAGKRQPDSADVQLEAGNIAMAQGNAALARAAWTAAAAAAPDSEAGKSAEAELAKSFEAAAPK
jgi:tetratricopeptide (TPR) repeat protein